MTVDELRWKLMGLPATMRVGVPDAINGADEVSEIQYADVVDHPQGERIFLLHANGGAPLFPEDTQPTTLEG